MSLRRSRSVLAAIACGGAVVSELVVPGPVSATVPDAPERVSPVGVRADETTTGIDATLYAGAAVSGTATVRNGSTITPFHGVVFAYPTDAGDFSGYGSATTAADGSFSITGLNAAENPDGVFVCVYPDDYFDHPPEWYGGCSGSGTPWDGESPKPGAPVLLHDGQVTTGARVQVLSRPRPGWGEVFMKVRGTDGTSGQVPRIAAFDVNTGKDVVPYRNEGGLEW